MTIIPVPHAVILNTLKSRDAVIHELTDGLSESAVYVIENAADKSVVKIQRDQTEYDFFTQYAPKHLHHVSWLPKLINHGSSGTENWLQFEYVVNPWPESNWNHDIHALAVLAELHLLPHAADIALFDNRWLVTDIQPLEERLSPDLIAMMYRFQAVCDQRHDKNQAMCTGDAYPLNWRCRENGELVKIDWQLFSFQNRAADIASWLSTYPDFDLVKSVAKKYLAAQSTDYSYKNLIDDEEELAIDVIAFFGRRMALLYKFFNSSSAPQKWRAVIDQLEQPLTVWMKQHADRLRVLD